MKTKPVDIDYEKAGAALRQARESFHLTLDEVVILTKVSRMSIHRVETGLMNSVRFENVWRLFNLFNLKLNDYIDDRKAIGPTRRVPRSKDK